MARGQKVGNQPTIIKKKKYQGVTGVRKEQDIMKHKIIDYLIELLEYEPGMKLPTISYKKIEEYRGTCGFEILYETIIKQTDSIKWALNNKEFQNETRKICYIFAIIQNNIGGVLLEKKKNAQKEVKTEAPDILPADLDINNDYVRKVRDFSAYVEED